MHTYTLQLHGSSGELSSRRLPLTLTIKWNLMECKECSMARQWCERDCVDELAGRGPQPKRHSHFKQQVENRYGSKFDFFFERLWTGKLAPPSNLCRPTQTHSALLVGRHGAHHHWWWWPFSMAIVTIECTQKWLQIVHSDSDSDSFNRQLLGRRTQSTGRRRRAEGESTDL
jgi:hypothetical protein